MGKKIEKTSKISEKGDAKLKEQSVDAKRTSSEVAKLKSFADTMATDVDDEVLNAMQEVKTSIKAEALNYMQTEVKNKLQEGKSFMENANKESSEQIQKNEQVKSVFAKMDSVGKFGKSTRESGKTKIDQSTSEFKKQISDNQSKVASAEKDYQKALSDISGTF